MPKITYDLGAYIALLSAIKNAAPSTAIRNIAGYWPKSKRIAEKRTYIYPKYRLEIIYRSKNNKGEGNFKSLLLIYPTPEYPHNPA